MIRFNFDCDRCIYRDMCRFFASKNDLKKLQQQPEIDRIFGKDSILKLSLSCSKYEKAPTIEVKKSKKSKE